MCAGNLPSPKEEMLWPQGDMFCVNINLLPPRVSLSLEEQCHKNQDFVVLWGELSPKGGGTLACGPN